MKLKAPAFSGLIFICGLFASFASAIPHRQSADHKANQYLSEGVFIGGRTGMGASLLELTRNYDPKTKVERVVIQMGDHEAKPLLGSIGFFHVGVDKKNKRAVVDMSQMTQSRLDEKMVIDKVKKSPLIKKAQLIYDPYKVSTQLILDFKTDVAVETFYLVNAKDPTRLVLDIRSLSKGKKL